ncbi:MAG: CoA-binding protein, partial [Deltaproteobacteria bacterium]|nr:CoA-binding protein [Deltaproteobacteria bacterium]
MEKKESDIESLFEPQSIAVVGASQDPRKLGYRVLENIVHGGYQNPVYPINPRGGAILGVPVFPELEAVDRCIDTAVIVIPAAFVFESIRSCAAKGVKHAVIITSGFAEVGNSEEEKKIASYARDHGVRILGPNIFGIYSAAASLNATFSTGVVTPGTIAIITQSGALGASMIGKTAVENMGVSAMVSVGNKADIDESDLLEYLLGQERTKVILMYIEGVRNGERLLGTLTTATRAKPVIVIKAGRSAKGAVAAASHTGSLAGSDEVFDDLMKQCGAIRAETINEAFKWCRFLSHNPLPKGDHTVIITNGGGIGVMCADACEKYGVPLYDDPAALGETYADVVPEFGSKKNPIDLTGQATTAAFDDALTAAGKSADTDAVIALACEVAVFDPENLSHLIEKHCREYKRNGKALAFSFVGGERMEHCIRTYSAQGYPVFGDVYEAVSCVGALYSYHRYLSRRPDEEVTADIDLARIDETVRGVLVDKRNFVLSDEAREIMDAARIPMPTGRIAHSLDEAIQHSEEIGFPVVMKVVS